MRSPLRDPSSLLTVVRGDANRRDTSSAASEHPNKVRVSDGIRTNPNPLATKI